MVLPLPAKCMSYINYTLDLLYCRLLYKCVCSSNQVAYHFSRALTEQGNQRWQTSPAAPPGGLGHCHTGMCMSNFMMIGWEMAEILHIEISRKHVSVTYDLDLWPKILKIFVSHGVPIRNMYAKFHNDRLRNGWDITLWNFAKTRTNTHTHTHTNRQTWALQYLALPLWGAR